MARGHGIPGTHKRGSNTSEELKKKPSSPFQKLGEAITGGPKKVVNKIQNPPCTDKDAVDIEDEANANERMITAHHKNEKHHPFDEPNNSEAGTHQFIADFFRSDMMNHVEFLKKLKTFEEDDAYLIAEICERLADQTSGITEQPIEPFYGGKDDSISASEVGHIARDDFQKHKSFPRNCYNIIMVYASLCKLKGHDYNVYELGYLNHHSKTCFRVALLIFVIQVVLLGIVLTSNFAEYEVVLKQKDKMVALVDICMTIFFTTFCFGQYDSSKTFTDAVRGVIGGYLVKDDDRVITFDNERGKFEPELMLFMNSFINQYCLILAPLFNFYFILLSPTAMDALLDSFSLLFIFELDDYILPLFTGIDIEDKLVINAHDFIMIPPVVDDLSCTKSGDDITPNVKLYVSIQKQNKSITIYSRVNATKYKKTIYKFDGIQTNKFLSMCDESLECLQNFKDIHD